MIKWTKDYPIFRIFRHDDTIKPIPVNKFLVTGAPRSLSFHSKVSSALIGDRFNQRDGVAKGSRFLWFPPHRLHRVFVFFAGSQC